jgi:N-acetylmuramoyl-L-alanine amidase
VLKSLMTGILVLQASAAYSCDEKTALALNMYHEARGEGSDGMAMVGEVTLTRVAHPRFPNTVCEVVYQRRQFSWTGVVKDHTPYETKVWEEALEIAEAMLAGTYEFFDTGATHYINPGLLSRKPSWTRSMERIGRVGNHVFYRM